MIDRARSLRAKNAQTHREEIVTLTAIKLEMLTAMIRREYIASSLTPHCRKFCMKLRLLKVFSSIRVEDNRMSGKTCFEKVGSSEGGKGRFQCCDPVVDTGNPILVL